MSAVSDDKSGDIMSIPGAEDQIDPATFEQILEMDDDETEREFSKSIVYDFFGQADSTFAKMDKELKNKDTHALKDLSELGHFLKGSSATLGLTKVKDSCEKIQHYGSLKDDDGTKDIKEEVARAKLAKVIEQAKKEFDDVKDVLKEFYKDTA
ncbi:Phosphorelay intermediate protein [Coniothyrium glycines]